MTKTKNSRIGVALSGGGALGIAHIGVLQSLADHDIAIDGIAGTSAGAIVAACHAFGVPMEKVVERIRELRWYAIPKLSFSGLGLFSHAALTSFIEDFLKDARIEDARIPLAIIATDLETGECETFTKGPLMSALTASASIPGIFVPVAIGDRLLVDGSLADNLPFAALKEMGADVRIGVNVNRWVSERRPKNLLDVTMRALEIAATYRGHAGEGEVLIEPHLEAFTPSDFSKADGMIKEGYRAATLSMKHIKALAAPGARPVPAMGWWDRFKAWLRT